jgi:hypothetical protein
MLTDCGSLKRATGRKSADNMEPLYTRRPACREMRRTADGLAGSDSVIFDRA